MRRSAGASSGTRNGLVSAAGAAAATSSAVIRPSGPLPGTVEISMPAIFSAYARLLEKGLFAG